MPISPEAQRLLDQAGSLPGAKFPTLKTTVGGIITDMDVKQQTDLNGTPKNFDDGTPRMEVVIVCMGDDGERFGFYASGKMLEAIKEAVKAATSKTNIEPGARLEVTWIGEIPAKKAGHSPTKTYSAEYTAEPKAGVNLADLA